MADNTFPDLLDVLVNVGQVIQPFTMMVRMIIMVIALYLFVSSLVELWATSSDGALKYIPGNQRYSVGSALVTMIVSMLLFTLTSMGMWDVFGNTLFGEGSSFITSEHLKYADGAEMTAKKKVELGIKVLLSILQAVGFIAIAKGFLIIHSFHNNQSSQGWGTAMAFLIGGTIAWNMLLFTRIINETIGFDIIAFISIS